MLLIILAVLVPTLAAALWLSAVLLQGWLYNDLARRLPLRALGGGAVLALFLTAWCAIYKADPGRFDTLFSFKTEALDQTATEFQSVRRVGKEEKKPVKYTRGGTGSDFASAETGRAWKRSDADGMVVALLIPEKGKTEPTRFNAQLSRTGRSRRAGPVRRGERVAVHGRGVPRPGLPGPVVRDHWEPVCELPARGAWVVVFWLGMRFAFGHAVGIGLAFWAVTMIAVSRRLFKYVAPNA